MTKHRTLATLVALTAAFVASTAHAELRCDRVTPAELEKICGVKTHVVAGAGEDTGEKDCSRLLTADDVPGAKRGGVSIHVLKSATPLTADPKWADVKPVAGFDAAFSYTDEPVAPTEPSPGHERVIAVAASRGRPAHARGVEADVLAPPREPSRVEEALLAGLEPERELGQHDEAAVLEHRLAACGDVRAPVFRPGRTGHAKDVDAHAVCRCRETIGGPRRRLWL